ncbi:hypothetical protein FAD87_RS09425 [Enterococcus hirae]
MKISFIVFVAIFMFVGWYIGLFIPYSSFGDYWKKKAICKKFRCKENEFSYYLEDSFGYYIVSIRDEEYRVKFSSALACQVVYCQAVEHV